MTDTKHTPGPWVARKSYAENGRNTVIESAPMTGNVGLVWGSEDEECVANARLIAAAPDLLAACEAGLRSLTNLWRSEFETYRNRTPEENDPAVAQMRSAIAKARGTP